VKQRARRSHEGVYWWLGAACAIGALSVDISAGVSWLADAAYLLIGVAGFVLAKRKAVQWSHAILAHTISGMLLLAHESWFGTGVSNTGPETLAVIHQTQAAFTLIGVVGLTFYGGARLAPVALLLAFATRHHVPSLFFKTRVCSSRRSRRSMC
jgi:hypothetical protein